MSNQPEKKVIIALPAIEPVSRVHAVQHLLCLPSMIPVRQTRWLELDYTSSKRYVDVEYAADDKCEDLPDSSMPKRCIMSMSRPNQKTILKMIRESREISYEQIMKKQSVASQI